MADYQNVTDGRPDGAKIGWDSTEKLGFWGATPLDQPASASQATVSAQTTKTTTALRTDLDNVITLANQLRNDLVSAGIIKGSA